MKVKPFPQRVWPLGRTLLFQAIQEKKFHSFIVRDGLTRGGVRLIDVGSAIRYLRRLSDNARSQEQPQHKPALARAVPPFFPRRQGG